MSDVVDPLVIKGVVGVAGTAGLGAIVLKFLAERWLRQVDEKFQAHDVRLDELDKYTAASRTVAHDDLGRVSSELGKLSVRQERVEEDLREATTELKEATRDWRSTFRALEGTVATLDKTVFALEKTVSSLVLLMQEQQRDKLRER